MSRRDTGPQCSVCRLGIYFSIDAQAEAIEKCNSCLGTGFAAIPLSVAFPYQVDHMRRNEEEKDLMSRIGAGPRCLVCHKGIYYGRLPRFKDQEEAVKKCNSCLGTGFAVIPLSDFFLSSQSGESNGNIS